MSILLQTRALTLAFGGIRAVDGLDLDVREGELLGLIGPNGAGKTTVFNLVTGVYRPSAGKILYRDRPLVGLPPHEITRLGIARTFQNIRLFSTLSVLENVMLGHALRVPEGLWGALTRGPATTRRRREWVRRAQELLDFVGLRSYEDELATSLPYGKQRLLEIARALATECDLLLLDEPAAGMNRQEKRELMALVRQVRERLGKTVLIIEHDMRLVMELVDRVVVLDHGRKIAEGPPVAVKNDPAVIEAYLGQAASDEAV